MNQKYYRRLVATAVGLILTGQAFGHGWTDYPKARQTICADDGGYWSSPDGSAIPNEACRNAFLESGTYPFVQKNEFSANVANFRDMSAVQTTVADGQLCSAGSSAKSGIDIPSAAWRKTIMAEGVHRLRFRATAPHNPSFWQIYLSKPGFDSATEQLHWSDLDLIQSYGDLPVINSFYEMDVTIPAGRSGSGILFVRWQRDDAGGEGFYNCSDIAFDGTGATPPPTPDPDPDPDPQPEPALVSIGAFVSQGHDIAEAGDSVRFRLFDDSGVEVIDEQVAVTDANTDLSHWARDLALKVNDIHSNTAFVGVWHEGMEHLMYDDDNVFSNRVWALNESYSFSVSVIPAEDTPPPAVEEYEYQYPQGQGNYKSGTVVLGTDGQLYRCLPFPYSGWCNQAPLYYAPGAGLAWDDAWEKL